jgi:XTP/dITP diphosphohydrolase
MDAVLATGNAGKLSELRALLAPAGLRVRAQAEFGCADADETGLSFVENALIKARHAARHTGLPAIADDSGLACDALGGAPGIRSARYAGVGAGDAANVARLLTALADVPEARRGCRFLCVIVYLAHAEDPWPLIAQGAWAGQVARAPRGDGGFGYDPVFEVPGTGLTAAQLAPERKLALSHRAQALAGLLATLAAAPHG